MGFLDRFFGKKKEDVEEKTLKASELSGFIQELEAGQNEALYRGSKPVLDDIAALMESLIDEIESIDSAEAPETTPERIKSILKTSKPVFIKAMKDSSLGLEDVPKPDELKAYRKKLDEFIASAPKLILGQGRYLHYPFGEELEKIRFQLKALHEKKKELDSLLQEDAYSGVKEDTRRLLEAVSRKQMLESEEKMHKKGVKEHIALEKELMERFAGSEKTSLFKEYSAKKKSLDKAVDEKESIENELYNLLTPMKKTIRTILHSFGSDHPSGISRKHLMDYAENPLDAFISQEAEERALFFSNLRELLQADGMGLKEDKLHKAASILDSISSPDAEEKRQRLLKVRLDEKSLAEEVKNSPYLEEKYELDRRLEKVRRETSQCRSELEKICKKAKENNEEIKSLKTKVEERLSDITGKRIIIETT